MAFSISGQLRIYSSIRTQSFRKKGALKVLSPKQQEVAIKVMQGHSNRRIAEILGITEQTVKDHLHTISEKLRLKNRWELIVFPGGKTGSENLPGNDRNP
jgi:DNA-binding NarL/FixJ family response regulator|uniref:LuxR family transcriptional regulator n=1 Tax=Leptospirillum ferriphilum TaxID=178606 RepID=A0A7C3LUE4_9BACT